ncbi:MAG: uracil-DNA glycosylase [Planctomycetes bacterium]|nr:uracil-DNA glycosylase [Planctomycetota bacterium]
MDDWHLKQHADFVTQIYEQGLHDRQQILPDCHHVFDALTYMRPHEVKVLILGQDPYPTPGDAHGLAFSVEHGKAPRSLKNIFIELHKDYPGSLRENANLSDWAQQGVLLLNAVLTVPAGDAAGHSRIGWQDITAGFLQQIAEHNPYVVWILWGAKAQKTAKGLMPDHHDVLQCGHPSPLAYNQNKPSGFKDCGHFKRCNHLLKEHGLSEIDWV